MNPDDSFAFLLPFIMLTFGGTFLIVSRYGSRSAQAWGLAYGLNAIAFAMPMAAGLIPIELVALTADALFLGGFFFFGQALLLRFKRPTFARLRIGYCILAFLIVGFAVVGLRSLPAELILHDIACASLLLVPVVVVSRFAERAIDRALVALAALVVIETILRTTILAVSLARGGRIDDFATSDYAFLMQATASVVGLLLALTALAAVTLDVIADYRDSAERDPLTGLLNRRGFDQAFAGMPAGTSLAGHAIACDLDHFKRINDTFGHIAGDHVLVSIAALIRDALPRGGFAARFGGEEFVVFLPRSSLAEASAFADIIRAGFAGTDWRIAGIDQQITVSIGIASTRSGETSPYEAVGRADQALYRAKAAGRNQVMLEADRPTVVAPPRIVSVL